MNAMSIMPLKSAWSVNELGPIILYACTLSGNLDLFSSTGSKAVL